MLFDHLILPGVLIPSAVALAVVLIAAWISRVRGKDFSGAGLAVAAAFLSGFVAATGWPRWPPVGSSQKLFYVVALAAILGLIAAALRRPFAVWFLRGALTALLLVFLLQPKLDVWSPDHAAFWLVGLLLAGVAVAWAWGTNLEVAAERGDLVSATVRAAAVGGSAVVLGLSESALLAQLAGAVACGVVVVEAAGLVLERRLWRSADAIAVSTALIGLLVIGHFYAGLEPLPAILLVLAHLLLALPGERWWQRAAPLVPLAIALGIVVAAALTEEDDPYDDYSALPGAHAPGYTLTPLRG